MCISSLLLTRPLLLSLSDGYKLTDSMQQKWAEPGNLPTSSPKWEAEQHYQKKYNYHLSQQLQLKQFCCSSESLWLDLFSLPHTNKIIIIICPTHVSVWESIGKACTCTRARYMKNCIFYYKSHENPYQVLQVTWDASERAMKSNFRTIKSLSP